MSNQWLQVPEPKVTALEPMQYALGALSGGLVSFTLGLFGGGGSILAVPLMVYCVGVPSPHMAIGTSAVAVAANAASGLMSHARKGSVRWRCALFYSVAGVGGALGGSFIGKSVDGQKLLFLFALLMLIVAVGMFQGRRQGDVRLECAPERLPKVMAYGVATGTLSGFFGIGGGFLIVPGLMASTGMPILNAIASSLVAVTAFGLTTSLTYARSGYVDWPLALVFVAGGIFGGIFGVRLACHLSLRQGSLTKGFACLVTIVALYMLMQSAQGFFAVRAY